MFYFSVRVEYCLHLHTKFILVVFWNVISLLNYLKLFFFKHDTLRTSHFFPHIVTSQYSVILMYLYQITHPDSFLCWERLFKGVLRYTCFASDFKAGKKRPESGWTGFLKKKKEEEEEGRSHSFGHICLLYMTKSIKNSAKSKVTEQKSSKNVVIWDWTI